MKTNFTQKNSYNNNHHHQKTWRNGAEHPSPTEKGLFKRLGPDVYPEAVARFAPENHVLRSAWWRITQSPVFRHCSAVTWDPQQESEKIAAVTVAGFSDFTVQA